MAVTETERLIAELFDAIDDIKLRLTRIEAERKAFAPSTSGRYAHVIGLVAGMMLGVAVLMVVVVLLLVHVRQ